jgi:hypothetical protein
MLRPDKVGTQKVSHIVEEKGEQRFANLDNFFL